MFTISDDCYAYPHLGGVYQIKNQNNGKIYIGSSKDIVKRYQSHKYQLESGKHANKALQEDYNKGNDFVLSTLVILACPIHEDLYNHEREEIEKAKEKGKMLYNAMPLVHKNAYISDNSLVWDFANFYCHEKFGYSIGQILNMVPARKQVFYNIAFGFGDEKSLSDKYYDAIEFQNKERYYHGLGIDYNQCVIDSRVSEIPLKTILKLEKENVKRKKGKSENIEYYNVLSYLPIELEELIIKAAEKHGKSRNDYIVDATIENLETDTRWKDIIDQIDDDE